MREGPSRAHSLQPYHHPPTHTSHTALHHWVQNRHSAQWISCIARPRADIALGPLPTVTPRAGQGRWCPFMARRSRCTARFPCGINQAVIPLAARGPWARVCPAWHASDSGNTRWWLRMANVFTAKLPLRGEPTRPQHTHVSTPPNNLIVFDKNTQSLRLLKCA